MTGGWKFSDPSPPQRSPEHSLRAAAAGPLAAVKEEDTCAILQVSTLVTPALVTPALVAPAPSGRLVR
eukprot:1190022-Prorocentrum_minimum.AAC.1